MSDPNPPRDPFQQARKDGATLRCPFQGEAIPMILRHAEVRAAAKDWNTFSSDAAFRVPIPSEEDMRSMRQLPIETNPPEHTAYRAIVAPFFNRSKSPEVVEKVQSMIGEIINESLQATTVEAVHKIALPIQSRALTYLLNVPETEADTYIGWGIHVFNDAESHSEDSPGLEAYLHSMLDRAEEAPGNDLFSALTLAEIEGRRLTREEMMGFGNLTFAGGRDTIIHSISNIIAHFAENPADLEWLRGDPKRVIHASEEFFRVFMPLTQIGRVCPVATDVHGAEVPAGGRIGLGWVSANHDEAVFENPNEVRLDRKPNPHLSFGFGKHLCLGAPHARLLVRTLIQTLMDRVSRIEVIEATPHVESNQSYTRHNGYDRLVIGVSDR